MDDRLKFPPLAVEGLRLPNEVPDLLSTSPSYCAMLAILCFLGTLWISLIYSRPPGPRKLVRGKCAAELYACWLTAIIELETLAWLTDCCRPRGTTRA